MSSMRLVLVLFLSLALCVVGTPTRTQVPPVVRRQAAPSPSPTFPPSPPSCPICAQSFPGIDSCAQAAPAFANFSQIIFAPGEFIDLIKCACTDTFQSAYPQCVDCFQQTNQTEVLDPTGDNLPTIVSGLRSVCALASTLLGNVTGADGEQVNGTSSTLSAPSTAPSTTLTPSGALPLRSLPVLLLNLAMSLSLGLSLALAGCIA